MAMKTWIASFGVDVCKEFLDISDGQRVERIANTEVELRRFLKRIPGKARFAVEPTQRYQQRLVYAALGLGHTVYLVDAYRLSRYREAIGLRAKTDAQDAELLHRYLMAEAERLRAYRPPPKAVQTLRELLAARARLTVAKGSIDQALREIGTLANTRRSVIARLTAAITLIDQQLTRCLDDAGYAADSRRCQDVPGIGPLNATALVATYHRYRFASADAFVAFLGLDLRVRESGRYRGQRKLSKRGDPEIRRLLFNAARAGARTEQWRAYYQRLRQRGLSTTAAYVALSRKLARIAFALLRDQSEYRRTASA